MNLILVNDADFITNDEVILRDDRARHIYHVHKACAEQTLKVGKLNGLLGLGQVLAIDKKSIHMRLTLDTPPPAKIPLKLVLALPRPKVIQRVLRTITELGIGELTLINCKRVEKSYWGSSAMTDDNIQRCVAEGLSLAKDTIPPRITLEKRFRPFVEDRLPNLLIERSGYLAHFEENQTHTEHFTSGNKLLVIGPEGGFIPFEIEKLQHAGLHSVSYGKRIMRVETAVPTLVTHIMA